MFPRNSLGIRSIKGLIIFQKMPKAPGIGFCFVLINAAAQVVGDADVQGLAKTGEDVNVILLHQFDYHMHLSF